LCGNELLQLFRSVELFARRVAHPVTGEQVIDESDISLVAHFRKETAYHTLVLFEHRILLDELDPHGTQFD
jgi:hypothetical protein